MTEEIEKKATPTGEIGVTGLKAAQGLIFEEFLQQLTGTRGIKVYQEMSDNDSTVGAILAAIGLLVRPVTWRIVPAPGPEGQQYADFVQSLMNDMEMPWADFMSEALTCLTYGWSWQELVYKKRVGPDETSPDKRSKFTDGRIGLRKIAPRSQATWLRWELADNGDILGMHQLPWTGGGINYMPIEDSLLIRTTSVRNNPEGRSVLRSAYRSWYYLKRIQESEAIGIERELAGLPVVKVPGYLLSSAKPEDQAILAAYVKIARDLKLNEQGGLVIPSDPWTDAEGRPVAGTAKVDVSLMSTAGSRAIDTNVTAVRYQRDIARTVMADFLMLGTDGGRGSYALSQDKTNLFLRSVETLTWTIADALDRQMLPPLWRYNGFPVEMMPKFEPGKVAPVNFGELGVYLRNLALAGIVLPTEPSFTNFLWEESGLPSAGANAEAL